MDSCEMIEDFNAEISINSALVEAGKISWTEFKRRQADVEGRLRAAGLFDAWVSVMLEKASR